MRRQPNTLVAPKDVEDCVLLVGGEHPPLVSKLVAITTESCKLVTQNRGFFTYRCSSRQGTPFTLAITGVGPSATEIAFVEYVNCGARVFIRAGTSGALTQTISAGSVVITSMALRFDGVSDLYAGKRLGAIADSKVIRALEQSAQMLGIEHRIGVTLSTSGFYAMGGIAKAGEIIFGGEPLGGAFKPRALKVLESAKESALALNVEMETATLLTLSRIYGLRSGSVCGISNRIPWDQGEQIRHTELALRNAIVVAIEALDRLHNKQSEVS